MNITMSLSCSKDPDSLKSDSTGRLSVLCSTARLSCAAASTGTFNSRASTFKLREMNETSCTRLSLRDSPPINWR